jgi:putative hydrolase of the HAD superfamily
VVIFFDIDETLIDQRRAEVVAARHFLRVYGHLLPPCSVAAFCWRWRALREAHAPAFFAGRVSYQEQRRRRVRELFAGDALLDDAEADRRFALFLRHYRRGWRLFEDVRPCLDSLAGHELGIISNGSSEQQRRKLRRTGIRWHFGTVVISEEVGAAKPSAAICRTACRRARCRPADAVYVGDRLDTDVRASQEVGMRAIWLNRTGAQEPADVETVRSLGELVGRLRGEGSSLAVSVRTVVEELPA